MTTNPRRWRFFQSREFLPVKVAIIYAIISMAYIFGSDWIVEAGIGRGWQFAAQTYKGIAFVVVSAIIIALLIRRELRRYAQVEQAYARSQRMEAVGKLSSGIAHDFNNLLTVVAGNLELIEAEARQNPAITNRVATALLAADRGAELTRRLLAFSRHQIMEPSNVNVNETIRRMTRLLHSVLGEGIEVKEALASNLPLIRVDPRQLESAILNLAINSRDALPQGGQITLITEFAALDKPLSDTRWPVPAGRYVIVAVSDNGVGIPDSVQVRLFEPFFTTKPEGRGTGLGLSIIGNFIKEFDGHVTVTSTESHGTTVRLYFPEAAPPSAQDAAPAGQGAVVRGGDETILLVENDRGVKDVIRTFLEKLGYRVLSTERVDDAIAILERDPEVRLLLTDIMLGGQKTGIELAYHVRQIHPDLAILLVSGYADPTITGQLADLARVGWLAKPFGQDALARRVRQMLDQ